MPQPVISRESPTDLHVSLETIPGTTIPTDFRPDYFGGNDDDTKPPTAQRKGSTAEAPLTASEYFGSSPWKHKGGGLSLSGFRAFAAPPLLHFSPRPLPAMATVNVNKMTASAGNKTPNIPAVEILDCVYQNGPRITQQPLPSMQSYGHCEENADGLCFSMLPQVMSMRDGIDDDLALRQVGHDQIVNQVEDLRWVIDSNSNKVVHHGGVLSEMIHANKGIYEAVQTLRNRMEALESNNDRLESMFSGRYAQEYNVLRSEPAVQSQGLRLEASDTRSRGSSPARLDSSYRDRRNYDSGEAEQISVPGDNRRTKCRKQLKIKIPGATVHSLAGLPTPLSRTSTALSAGLKLSMPKTPITPGRIGPGNMSKRSSTSINKRKNHSLDKMLPPAYVRIPHVPLTDTEVIVYFFQSLSRPNVALRLYAREWGPRNIVDTLHSHRLVEPPYLRNTCSVKCTTAIKMGRKRYGDDWEDMFKLSIKEASDEYATDIMRLEDDEWNKIYDYDVRSLCVGLIKHPEVGNDGGIFTRCVKYCEENDVPYTIHDIWQLADDLESGRTPKHPEPSKHVAVGTHGGFPLFIKNQDEEDESDKMSEDSAAPSQGEVPIAQRSLIDNSDRTITRSSTPESVFSEENTDTEDTT